MNAIIDKQIIPWQQRKEIGFIKALWDTVKQILFEPAEFFDNLEIKDSYLEPYSFYFIVSAVAMTIAQLIGLLLAKILLSILPIGKALHSGFVLRGFGLSLIPIFIFAAIGAFVLAAILHLFVRLFKGEKGFIASFNIIAYSAAGSIFNIIPIIGGLISFVWMLLIIIRGLQRIHNFNIRKAIVVYLCSFVLLFGIATALDLPNISKSKVKLVKARIEADEAGAKANCKAISLACKYYYDEHGFYPSSLTDLADSKPPLYFNFNLTKAVSPSSAIQGYYYVYERIDEEHFNLYAKPKTEGSQVFFIDQTGYLRLNGPDGPRVR